MEKDVILLNAMRWNKPEKNSTGTRISLVLATREDMSNSDNFTGFPVVDCFYETTETFSKVKSDLLGTPLKGTFKPVPQKSNPLKINNVLSEIITKNGVISLL